MDPQKFLQEYIFYTPEKIKEINEAQRQSAASNPAASTYKPRPGKKAEQPRSRYSQGASRPEVSESQSTEPKEKTGRDARRGTGLKNRKVETPELLQGSQIRGRSGAARGVVTNKPEKPAATPQAPVSTDSGMINRSTVEPINGSFSAAVRERESKLPKTTQESATPRQETVRNGAKGTQMTFEKMNEGLSAGITVRNPFASFTKPGDYSAEDASIFVKSDASSDERATKERGGFVESVIDGDKSIETKMVQGSPNLVMSGAVLSGEKTNNPKDPSTWDENYARRRAFLDADDSMQGLRNVQAQKGIVYAGGQYYRANENAGQEGQSDFVAIDQKNRADVKAYMRGDRDAQSFLGGKLADMKNISESSSLVAESQGGFEMMDEKNRIIGPNLTDMPAVTQKDSTGRFNVFYENRNPPSQR